MATDAAAQTAAEGSPAVGSPAGGAPAGGSPAVGSPAGGAPAGGSPAVGSPAGGAPAGGSPAVGSLAGSAPAGGAPAEGTPAAGTPAGSVPPGSDPVFDSLLSTLPGLTRDLMWLDADIRDAVTRSELDPAAISAQMEKRADDAMRATNREIAAIREARQALQDHTDRERGGRRAAAREGRVPRRAMALLIAALWLLTAWPVATWQAWPPLASATGGVAAAAVLAFGI